MSSLLCRSALYMPASNPRALEKARSLDTDSLIFDLEDAVSVEDKEMAREQARLAIESRAYGSRYCVVRINGLDTAWGQDDLDAFKNALPHAFAIPKVSQSDHVLKVAHLLDHMNAPENVKIWAMIETPEALLELKKIARLGHIRESRLSALVIGTNDLARTTSMRLTANRNPILPWLSIAAVTAKASNLIILDGVFNRIADMDGFLRECEEGKDLGFDGKTLIHPSQLEIANRVFGPSDEEIQEAEKIVALYSLPQNVTKNVISMNGVMVERLHYEMAQKTLEKVDVLKTRQNEGKI